MPQLNKMNHKSSKVFIAKPSASQKSIFIFWIFAPFFQTWWLHNFPFLTSRAQENFCNQNKHKKSSIQEKGKQNQNSEWVDYNGK